jgi:hypothetical protein
VSAGRPVGSAEGPSPRGRMPAPGVRVKYEGRKEPAFDRSFNGEMRRQPPGTAAGFGGRQP